MTRHVFRTLLAAVALVSTMNTPALLQPPAQAAVLPQAETHTLDFEEVLVFKDTEGTPITDTYEPLGVTFNGPLVALYQNPDAGVTDAVHSGTQAMHQCASTEDQCTTSVIMTFTEPQGYVGAWIGFDHSLVKDAKVTMTAFDAESGGTPVAANSLDLLATDNVSIPAQPLDVSDAAVGIRRVEVGFSPASLLAPDLVFDDVTFGPDPQFSTLGAPDPEQDSCLPEAAAPAVRFDQPKSHLVVHENAFPLKGRITTAEDLIEATLTREIDREIDQSARTQVLLPDTVSAQGGPIGPNSITGFLEPGLNTLTLRARNCAGIASVQTQVEYQPPADGTHYALQALEVTQTIQDPANGVRLVAGKRTFVRAFLATAGSSDVLTNVTGQLSACHVASLTAKTCDGGELALSPLASSNAVTVDSLTGADNLVAKRGTIKDGLLFELPPEWREAGYVHFWLDSSTLSPQLACDGCDTVGANTVWFQNAPTLTVDLVDVMYTVEDAAYTPSATHRDHLISWLKRAYPTNDVEVVTDLRLTTLEGMPTCDVVAQAMFAEWVKVTYGQKFFGDTPFAMTPTRNYGLVVAQREDDRNPMRGCALIGTTDSTDSRMDNEHFASGPAGTGLAWPWDLDGSYADWYGGHEIGHTFGRKHIAGCGQILEEGEEVEDSYQGTDGHIDWLDDDKQRIDYIGFDAGDATVNSPVRVLRADKWHDVMTYCPFQWVSAFTYNALWDAMKGDQATPNVVYSQELRSVTDDVDSEQSDDVEFIAPSAAVLLVVGTINKTTNKVDFRPLAVLPEGPLTELDDSGGYRIVLRDSSEQPLASYRFEPLLYSDRAVGADELAQLSEVVPWVDGTAFIDIQRGTNPVPIGRQPVSAHAPTVQITGPNGGEQLQGGVQTVTWVANDQDGDDLTYSLHYSTDGGATWQSLVSGWREQQFDVDLSGIPGSDQARFRVITTDGVLTASDESDADFSVEPHAPEVSIISPPDATKYGTSQTIVLVGEATDIDQGTLDGSTLRWTADGDASTGRLLGQGASIAVSDLPPGRHTLTLTATSADGLTSSSSIAVRIIDDEPEVLDWSDPQGLAASPDQPGPTGLFFYDNAEEAGAFFAGDGGGQLQPLRTFDVLLNGWSSVIPGNFGGDTATDLLFYASELGVGEFYASDGAGGMALLSGNEGFTKGWDLIVPGNFGPADEWTDLLFYDRLEGVGKFYTTDGTGKIELLGDPIPLGYNWTAIAAGLFNGSDRADIFLYDQATGQAQRYAVDEKGALTPQGEAADWGTGWDAIIPGHFGGDSASTDVVLYDADTGTGSLLRADDKGNLALPGIALTFPQQWDTLVAGNFGADSPHSDLFGYDAEQGQGTFYAINDQGGLEVLRSLDTLAQGWDQVVPGEFGHP